MTRDDAWLLLESVREDYPAHLCTAVHRSDDSWAIQVRQSRLNSRAALLYTESQVETFKLHVRAMKRRAA